MSNIKVIEILLGVLLTLMIFQIYFKSFKTVSDKQILFVLILVLLCDKLFNKSKKEHNTSDLAPVTVDGAAAVFDAEAFDNLNKIVKELAGSGTFTIPGDVIIEGTLQVKGDKVDLSTIGLQFDKKDGTYTRIYPKNWDIIIGRPEGNKVMIPGSGAQFFCDNMYTQNITMGGIATVNNLKAITEFWFEGTRYRNCNDYMKTWGSC